MGDIGTPIREIEFEPLTAPPVEEPLPEPAAPEVVPDPAPAKEPVPA